MGLDLFRTVSGMGVDITFFDAPCVLTVIAKQTSQENSSRVPTGLTQMPKSNFEEIICSMHNNSI